MHSQHEEYLLPAILAMALGALQCCSLLAMSPANKCSVAYLECAKGSLKFPSGIQGQRRKSWNLFINACLNFDVLEEQN